MVLNATFNNISVISWLSVLLVDETGVPGENHIPGASHWQISSHNVLAMSKIYITNFILKVTRSSYILEVKFNRKREI
jgi:hypothetical protein